MPAAQTPTRATAGLWWRCCLGLAVLAWVLRAWVPIGYMPTVVQGSLVLSICSGHQPGADLWHIVEFEQQKSTIGEECPYAMLLAQAAILPKQAVLPQELDPGVQLPLARGQLSLARAPPPGPPLGSRAPPLSKTLVAAHGSSFTAMA